MRILGIDPGTATLGFGVIDSDNQKLKFIDGGVITTKPDRTTAERLETIYNELVSIIAETKPVVMAVEKLFFAQNVTTAMTVSQARGVIMLCGQKAKLEIFEYTPLQIKQALTGYGRAEKKQIQEKVRVMLQMNAVPQPDDCADALAAAICHSMTVGDNETK